MLDYNYLDAGCFLSDALVIGVKCQGFSGAGALALILNLPLYLFYLPLFGIAGIFSGHLISIIDLLVGIMIWLPITFLGKIYISKFFNS